MISATTALAEGSSFACSGSKLDEAVVARELQHSFPGACAVGTCEVKPRLTLEFDDAMLARRFAPARKQQFLAGRFAAKTALGRLGSLQQHVPIGPHNEPVWPKGIIGTIAHTDDFAVAVAARQTEVTGLGVDLERVGELKPEMWEHILTPREINGLLRFSADEQMRRAAIAFSAKEAFFKLQFPHTQRWVDFTEAEVAIEGGEAWLSIAEPIRVGTYWRREFHGAYRFVSSHVIAGLWVV